MMRRIETFPHQTIKTIGLNTMQRKSSFAHFENFLLSMLEDTNYEVRSVAVDKIQNLRCIVQSVRHSTATVRKQNKVGQAKDKYDSFGTISKPYI